MSLYLHHYPMSPFSEKIRAMLGYLGLSWKSVVIPSVMPRPLLMPLSGGYRRTPCLQIDANIYCDTAAIARGLARHADDATLFWPGFQAHRIAEWADTQLFRVAVALNFNPRAAGAMLSQLSPEEVAAFGKDRAELVAGGSLVSFSEGAARAYLSQYLEEFESSLHEPFLFGSMPSIADFSIYHCLWFLRNSAFNAPVVERHDEVVGWMGRIAAFGHGDVETASGEEALAHARKSEPTLPVLDPRLPEGIELGDRVHVTPIDYGLIPVAGTLAACGVDEIVLGREDPQVGRVMTHFPSVGFEITSPAAA